MLLLDTCGLLWLAQGGGELSRNALERITAASVVYVSPITGFEITVKHRKGKLSLPAVPSVWFDAVLDHHDIQIPL